MSMPAVITLIFIINISSAFSFDANSLFKDAANNLNVTLHPDFGLDIYHYLKKYKYPLETHWVQTEDNYVLRMHRIPYGRNGIYSEIANKPAVLLMHGIMGSSMAWLTAGPNKSLALRLADEGFDVWLGNNRGNTWSRQHVTLNPDLDKEFWNFSYEKCGQYDLPAKIDYIIQHTSQNKIFYVGHSQGTTQFFAMASLRPEYNKKIVLMSALAPVVYLGHMSSPLMRILAKYSDLIENILKLLNINELGRYSWLGARFMGVLSADGSPFQELFVLVKFLVSGFNEGQLDRSILSFINSVTPDGLSRNMLLHYAQNIKTGHFRRLDYGTDLNWEYYGTQTPPDFKLSLITAPVALYYSKNDFFVPAKAAEKLSKELPNTVKLKMVNKYFNHNDFITAKDVNHFVNNDLIVHLKENIKNRSTISIPMNYIYAIIICIIYSV